MTEPEEYPGNPSWAIDNVSAADFATHFTETFTLVRVDNDEPNGDDWGLMVSWFAVAIENGKTAGYSKGYEEGHNLGWAEGYEAGHEQGASEGYMDGLAAGDDD